MTFSRGTLIVSALLAGLLPLVGNGLYDGGDSSGSAVLRRAEDGLPTIAYVAFPVELAGFAALCVLLACLVVLLAKQAPVAAVTAAVAGAAMVAVKSGSAAPAMALRVSHDGVDPATAELVAGLNGAAFVICSFLLGLAFAAVGIGMLRAGEPRWLAWWAAGAGCLGAAAGAVGIVEPDAFVPVPFLLLLLWMIAYGLTSALRTNRGIAVASPVPAPQ